LRSERDARAAENPNEENEVTLDRAVLAFAGLVVLISLALSVLYSPYWLLLTAFAGLNMIQASFTGFCPAALAFKRLGIKSGVAFR
jgi:fatty acid desaturase